MKWEKTADEYWFWKVTRPWARYEAVVWKGASLWHFRVTITAPGADEMRAHSDTQYATAWSARRGAERYLRRLTRDLLKATGLHDEIRDAALELYEAPWFGERADWALTNLDKVLPPITGGQE